MTADIYVELDMPITRDMPYSPRSLVVLHSMLDPFDHGTLPLSADLLCPLERNERQLEVVGSLLQ